MTRLKVLIDEFGSRGKRAYSLIANTLSGGFSVPSVKKFMQLNGLKLPEYGARAGGSADSDDNDEEDYEDDDEDDADPPEHVHHSAGNGAFFLL